MLARIGFVSERIVIEVPAGYRHVLVPLQNAHSVFDAEMLVENARRAAGIEIHDVGETY